MLPSRRSGDGGGVPIGRAPVCSCGCMPWVRTTRATRVAQAGYEWRRKMHSLALRLPKGRTRRDRSGAPMKRG